MGKYGDQYCARQLSRLSRSVSRPAGIYEAQCTQVLPATIKLEKLLKTQAQPASYIFTSQLLINYYSRTTNH